MLRIRVSRASAIEMYITQFRIVGGAPRLSAQETAGLFWARRAPDDDVEHVHVWLDAGGMRLTLFLLAGSQSDADRIARGFCVRVLMGAPELAGWRLLFRPSIRQIEVIAVARYPTNRAPGLDSIGAPLERTLNVLTARWSFLTLQALANDHVHFNELNRQLAGINHKVLIETLRLLQHNEFVKGPLNGGAVTEYRLTTLGRELLDWINEIKQWAEERRIAVESQWQELERLVECSA